MSRVGETGARVYVAGRGLVCGLGSNLATTTDAIFAGRSALRTAALPEAPPFPLARCEVAGSPDDPSGIVALAMTAVEEACREAKRGSRGFGSGAIDLIVASTKGELGGVVPVDGRVDARGGWGNVGRFAEAVQHAVTDAPWFKGFTVRGTTAISCACASGLAALAEAGRRIRARQSDPVLVVAADRLSSFMIRGFDALLALDAEPCRPFDRSRRGLSLGEGAGAMVLTAQRDASIGFELEAWGASNDANHITGPSRTGDGLALAIGRALAAVPEGADAIDVVHLHGTGTDYNDASEVRAITEVFPDSTPVLFGTKGQTGHTLGAAGVIESLIGIASLERDLVPANAGLATVDAPERLRLVREATPIERRGPGRVLKVAAGFGGVNAALVWTDRRGGSEEPLRVDSARALATPVSTRVPSHGILDSRGLRGTGSLPEERVSIPIEELRDARGRWRWPWPSRFSEFRRLDDWSRLVALVSAAAFDSAAADGARTGLLLGTTLGCLDSDLRFQASLAAGEQTASRLFPYTLPSAALASIAIHFGYRGPTAAVTTTHGRELAAVELAWSWLESGEVDRVHLVLGDHATEDDARRAGFAVRPPRAVAILFGLEARRWWEREADGVTQCGRVHPSGGPSAERREGSVSIVVTGVGLWTAAGRGVDVTVEALRRGRSGLGSLSLFESERCAPYPVAEVETAGMVGASVDRAPSRATHLAEVAARDAWIMSGLPTGGVEREAVGLALGNCVGGLFESEPEVERLVRGEDVDDAVWLRHEAGDLTSRLARRLDLGGPTLTVSTACTSGAKAIALGAELIDDGMAEVVLAGGVDALTRLTFHGFLSLLAVDPEGCRPFDRDRRGMSLGEGAGFVVLESEAHAARRNAPVLARLAGCGHSCDAHHPTAPHPEGRGAEAAIRAALEDARLSPQDVDYINAHGTGTPDNDRAESAAMRAVYGDHVPPFSSTKRVFGHTLAAAGAIEAIVSVLALDRGFLPGTVGFEEPGDDTLTPLRRTEESKPSVVVSHSFGFGGNNTVLCFQGAAVASRASRNGGA